MSFTGDLEHLPIVDVIQLLHATRKSGILRVACHKGESQLVFKEGYIVSANHLNGRVRIGTVLVDQNIVTADLLDHELQEQKNAGAARKPLIIALLEKGLVKEEDAYRCLERLIEMTVVEILTWKKGTFTLEVLPETASDEYRYYPGRLDLEVNVDTQGVLMDALRIYDEKMRDGQLPEDDSPGDETPATPPPAPTGAPRLSADDLGLADLDQLEKKIPQIFTGLEDRDPALLNRRKLAECAPELAPEQREELASFLGRFATETAHAEEPPRSHDQYPPLLFFSRDELFRHAVTTICRHAGFLVFATDEVQNLALIMAHSEAVKTAPILVLDAPAKGNGTMPDERDTARLRLIRKQHPHLAMIQLAPPDNAGFMLDAYDDGVRAVIPRPFYASEPTSFAADAIRFFQTFLTCVLGLGVGEDRSAVKRLTASLAGLRELRETPEVARAVLRFTAGLFERSLTLVVRGPELVADKGCGFGTVAGDMTSLGFSIPLSQPSLCRTIIETGRVHFGPAPDDGARDALFTAIGTPRSFSVMMLPLRFRGKTIALVYGDFGAGETKPVRVELLEILAAQAELLLENVAYRKKLEKTPVAR